MFEQAPHGLYATYDDGADKEIEREAEMVKPHITMG